MSKDRDIKLPTSTKTEKTRATTIQGSTGKIIKQITTKERLNSHSLRQMLELGEMENVEKFLKLIYKHVT